MPSQNPIANTLQLTTTNSGTQTLLSHTMVQDNCSAWFVVDVVARRLSDGATKAWHFHGCAKKNTGNVSTASELLGISVGTAGDLTALLLASAVVDDSGSDIRIRVSGLSSTDILWLGSINGNESCDD